MYTLSVVLRSDFKDQYIMKIFISNFLHTFNFDALVLAHKISDSIAGYY